MKYNKIKINKIKVFNQSIYKSMMILIQIIIFLEYNIFKYKSKTKYFKFIKAKYWIIN